jgi:hypothetical protein
LIKPDLPFLIIRKKNENTIPFYVAQEQMKGVEYILIVVGLLAVWHLTQKTQETFVAEFNDTKNAERTAETSSSSYKQETNHLIPTPPLLEQIPGLETPFRVNMFNSFQPV